MNFKPTYNRVILQPVERPNKTKSGIILPDGDKSPCQHGLVVAQGPDVTRVEVGDIVMFYGFDAQRIEIEGELFAHIREDHVVGTYIKEENNA